MSVSIRWAPAEGGKSLGCGTSDDLATLETVFGNVPIKLKEDDARVLRAMAATDRVGPKDDNPYTALAEIVETHGSITVWGEW